MRIVLAKSTAEAVENTVAQILNEIKEKPNAVIGLATGKTMEPVYDLWTKGAIAQGIDHSGCTFFMLDEYLGIKDNHPASFKHYIESRLGRPLQLKPKQVHFPPVGAVDLMLASSNYEAAIKAAGGIDLQLLGVGQNGHIGFNEPGSEGHSRTRIVELTAETRAANQSSFINEIMPTQALSMGIGTILEARKLVLLATGKSKGAAIKYLLNHHDDESCPVTFLKSHSSFNLILDPEAASQINLKI